MSYDLTELCPICLENPIKYYTECNHVYCIGCLCRIKKCAICRKYLLRDKLCVEIKSNKKNKITKNIHEFLIGQNDIYIPSYILLQIMSGMAGIGYSN